MLLIGQSSQQSREFPASITICNDETSPVRFESLRYDSIDCCISVGGSIIEVTFLDRNTTRHFVRGVNYATYCDT